MLLLVVFVLILLLLLFAYKTRKRQMTIFERFGIPGPKPNLIFGNAIEIAKRGSLKVFPGWTNKFGEIVGFYIGGRPQVLITDLDLIRQVMVKDFHVFTNRQIVVPGGIHPQLQMKNGLPWLRGSNWKQLRSTLSPSFSIAKVNRMEGLMMISIENMLHELDHKANSDDELNLRSIFEESSFSIITNSFTGLNLSLHDSSYDNFLQVSRPRLEKSMLAVSMLLFPSLTFIAYPLRVLWETIRLKMMWSPEGVCFDTLQKIVKIRKNATVKPIDGLQLLLDSSTIGNATEAASGDPLATKKLLTEEDIVSNAILFVIAGFETTSVTLQFVISNLVNNQDVQDQLRNELKQQIQLNDGMANLQTFTNVPLLLYVIKETLRLYPPGSPGTSRIAEEQYEYEGFRIPKGTGIFIGVSSIHNDPQLWPEPEKFKPERFAGEFNKLAFLPFGAG